MKMINWLMSRKLIVSLSSISALFFLLVFMVRCNKDDVVVTRADVTTVADGFVSPIGVVASPDNTNRLFVIDQIGKIWIIDGTGTKLPTPFMDVTATMVPLSPAYDERGLLGLAFHPQFATNHRFYIYYQMPPRAGAPPGGTAWNNFSRIAEFKTMTGNDNLADMSTERIILEMDDPQSNHNGGTIAFGPDGYLYIAIGDGGSANDVAPGHVTDWYTPNAGGNGQDIDANLFGDVLRIDVSNTAVPYTIPPDNPFVGTIHKQETYAYGFRNPFRFSFDMGGSHDLILGDAGQVLYEEINRVVKGGNYGWNVKEGKICFQAANNDTAFTTCPAVDILGKGLTEPVIIINNTANPTGGRALTVIGGNVYRGTAIPAYVGKYIFGTFAQSAGAPNGELFIATPNGQSDWSFEELDIVSHAADIGYYLKGFGQDNAGEIYLTVTTALGPSGTTGKVLKLVKGQ